MPRLTVLVRRRSFAAGPYFMRHFNRVAMPVLHLSFACPIRRPQLAGVVCGELLDGNGERAAPFFTWNHGCEPDEVLSAIMFRSISEIEGNQKWRYAQHFNGCYISLPWEWKSGTGTGRDTQERMAVAMTVVVVGTGGVVVSLPRLSVIFPMNRTCRVLCGKRQRPGIQYFCGSSSWQFASACSSPSNLFQKLPESVRSV
jgi:hypothetical protein